MRKRNSSQPETVSNLKTRRAGQRMIAADDIARQSYSKVKTLAPGLAGGPITLSNRTPTDVHDAVPKLPCPSCGKLISISLHDLLMAAGITCPFCLLVLQMDRGASQSAIEHMQNFYVAMKDIKIGH